MSEDRYQKLIPITVDTVVHGRGNNNCTIMLIWQSNTAQIL